jgi:hypothetical protein
MRCTLLSPGTLAWLNAGKDDIGQSWILSFPDFRRVKNLPTVNNKIVPDDLPGLCRAGIHIRRSCPTATFRSVLRVRISHFRADMPTVTGSRSTLRPHRRRCWESQRRRLVNSPVGPDSGPYWIRRSYRSATRGGRSARTGTDWRDVRVASPSHSPLSGSHSYRSVPVRFLLI